MLFLIEYNRSSGKIISLHRFDGSQRSRAEQTRLDLEVKLQREKINHEVVVLEAETEEAMRKTHRRYFEDVSTLTKTPDKAE